MTSRTAKARSRRLAWAACGVLALVLSGWAALVILLPPARVLAIARAQLSAALRREVRLDRASVSPWPPVRIELKGLAISEPEGFSRGSSFEARSLDLNLNLFALLLRRAVVRDFTLEQPVLHLVLRGDGTTNFDGLLSAPPPGGAASGAAASVPFDLAVHTCSVRGGRVMVDDVRAARRTVFTIDSRIALSIAGATRIATEGRTKFSNLARGPLGAARGSDLDRSLSDLALTLFHRGVYDAAKKRLALEMLSLRLGRAEISFRGVVDDPGPRARVRLSANGEGVDFSEVLRALAAAELPALHGVSGSGRMGFALDVNGALTSGRLPVVTGRVAVRDAAFRYPEASASVNALSFTARLAPDSLAIGDLSARVSGQPVRASLFVTRFANPELRFHVSGALDLAAVAPMFAPREARLSGRVSLDVSGVGRARAPDAIALSGRADLSNVRIESPQLPRPMERVSGAVEFASARAAVRNLTGAAGQSSFTLDATLERPLALMAKPDSAPPADVDFTLRSPYLDLAELLPPTPGPALLPNARGTGRIEIGRLRQERLDVRNVSARVRFDPVTFEVPQFSLDGYGGAVAGEAKFDLRNPANPGFAMRARIDSVQADALLSAWTPAHGVMKGSLSTTLDLSGAGTTPEQLRRTLTAVGLAAVTSGELGPTPALAAIANLTGVKSFEKLTFQELRLPIEVRDGRIATREVTIRSAGSDWKASGTMGFDGSLDYIVSALVPADQVAKLGADAALAVGALTDAQGRIHMIFRVGGNARNPRVSLDARALRDEIAGRLKNDLGGQGKKIERQLEQAIGRQTLTPTDSAGHAKPIDVAAVAESLKKIKGSDLLKSLFGGGRHGAADTTKR